MRLERINEPLDLLEEIWLHPSRFPPRWVAAPPSPVLGSRAAASRICGHGHREVAHLVDHLGHGFAEVFAELLCTRLHFDDHHLVGQAAEVARHHKRVVERDDAGHRLGHRALNLLVVRQDTHPSDRP